MKTMAMPFILNASFVVPILLAPATESDIYRIGGAAPVGVEPQSPAAKHLLTVGLKEKTFVTVFQTFEGNYDIDRSMEIIGPGDEIEVHFHRFATRRQDGKYSGAFSEAGIRLGLPRRDEHIDGEEILIPDVADKLGGKAFPFQGGSDALIAQLEAEGFAQFLQLDFSGLAMRTLKVTGDVPFNGGIFHLFLKPLEDGIYDWRCYWELF